MRLRTHLGVFAIAVLLPVLVFSVIAVLLVLRLERQAAEKQIAETTKRIALSVDRELARAEASLRVLASSMTLTARNFDAFRRQAEAAITSEGAWIVLFDSSGQQLVNTRITRGTPLPRNNPRRITETMRTQRISVSDLFTGAIARRLIVTVDVPVVRDGESKYVLSMALLPETLARVFEDRAFPADWIVAIFDRNGLTIARSLGAERFVGQPGRPELIAELQAKAEGAFQNVSREGIPLYNAFTRSELSGWSVVAGVPLSAMNAPVRRAAWAVAIGAFAAVILGIGLAAFVGRRIAAPVVGLTRSARELSRGAAPASYGDSVTEVAELGRALADAARLIRERDEVQGYLAALVQSSKVAIVGLTTEGVVIAWNEAAERVFGYAPHEMIGRHISLIVPRHRRHETELLLGPARRGERAELETVRITKSGAEIDVSITAAAVRTGDGATIGISEIVRDIGAHKRAERAVQAAMEREREARAEAEVANRAKDDFLATLSHELRTPLNAILGWVKMLRAGTLDTTAAQRALEVIERNAYSQNQLVTDLLDVSRIITGTMTLEIATVHLASIVDAALEAVRPAADTKNILITRTLAADVPMVADAGRIQQVVWNLLANAVKFTPSGGRIDMKLACIGASAQLVVRDTGKGISKEFLPHLFERFRQADSSTTRAHGGLGLGLAIVRHLVELHGGTVTAESDGEGKGSTFTVTLPAGGATQLSLVPPERVPTSGALLAASGTLEGVRVLIIDDDEDTCEMTSAVLKHAGASPLAVTSAREARRALRTMRPDVIVCDLGMPGEDGYDFIREVRAASGAQGTRIPAIAMTAYARQEDRQRSLAAGFQTHLPKPVEPVDLVAAVRKLARL